MCFHYEMSCLFFRNSVPQKTQICWISDIVSYTVNFKTSSHLFQKLAEDRFLLHLIMSYSYFSFCLNEFTNISNSFTSYIRWECQNVQDWKKKFPLNWLLRITLNKVSFIIFIFCDLFPFLVPFLPYITLCKLTETTGQF